MIKRISASLLATVAYFAAAAQDPVVTTEEVKPTTTLTGSVDVYYRYDFGKNKGNSLTSFTPGHNSFELGMATLKVEHKTEKVAVVADLGFGPRAMGFSYNDQGILASIKQLYVSYAPAEWVKFTMGSWATHVGYELVDAYANRNYSMSYMFTNGPFFHTGARVDLTKGKSGLMVGIANPTDFKTAPAAGINKKALLAQYSYAASDNVKFYANYVGGQNPDSSKSKQFDLVVTGKVSDKFSIGYNGTVNRTKRREDGKFLDGETWWGSALYFNVDPKSWYGLTLRTELFNDKNRLKIMNFPVNEGGNIFATTLSANFKVHSFTIIPEVRYDAANKDIFWDGENGAMKSSNGHLMLAAIYTF